MTYVYAGFYMITGVAIFLGFLVVAGQLDSEEVLRLLTSV